MSKDQKDKATIVNIYNEINISRGIVRRGKDDDGYGRGKDDDGKGRGKDDDGKGRGKDRS